MRFVSEQIRIQKGQAEIVVRYTLFFVGQTGHLGAMM